ncbi:MAG: hypothetical protein FJZ01_27060 [Candidatus Sericytochromatia bacterium]|nr:hypothetical protein [Candidatus Tanganyikabacteria bacterium]
MAATSSTPDVSDLAGSSRGYQDGPGRFAKFDTPYGLATDASGSVLVADSGNRSVRVIGPDGLVSTHGPFSADTLPLGGTPVNAFGFGDGIDFGLGRLVLADSRKGSVMDLPTGATPSVIAGNGLLGFVDGENASASFSSPSGILVQPDGSFLVADTQNHCIRWITPAGNTYTWLGSGEPGLQDGSGQAVRFSHPTGLAEDDFGNLYIADTGNHVVRRVDIWGQVSTLAGTGDFGDADGPAASATFDGPTGLAVDDDGAIYVADTNNNCIRRISASGFVTTLSGTGVAGSRNGGHSVAQFNRPSGLVLDGQGRLLVADTGNHRIRKIRVR